MPEAIKPCPLLTLSPDELQKFQKTQPNEVSAFLASLEYGPSKILVDSFYLSPDKRTGVGTLEVREETTRDHFGTLRGVDSVEAIAQTAILLGHHTGALIDRKPLFAAIYGARFVGIATTGAVLNMVVERMVTEDSEYAAHGWTLRSKTVLTEAEIGAATTDSRSIEALKRRAAMLQAREKPLFAI